ncbi:exported hypothetical protein [Alteromonas sp. 38]|uniref:hypothetical protein n=1 Tax=Alteromonas TaxID=226 RepID=UPI0012EF1A12|nr:MULTISPECIES: hypothetical protein [Alteromonas]CAD5288371.1 exported hypothetical protein [Alteromonas sp. 154]VXB26301.1 exported hypothetical protein [Alteromonas sp. 38]
MKLRFTLYALIAASLLTFQASAAIIPTGLNISGVLLTDLIEGDGDIIASLDRIENSIIVPSTTISGPLDTSTTIGDDPLEIDRLTHTSSGFKFESNFNGVAGALGESYLDGQFIFVADNQTTDDFALTWSLVFSLTASAGDEATGDFMNTYLVLDNVFSTLFERDLFSDTVLSDLLITDGVESEPGTRGAAISTSGEFFFMQTVSAGSFDGFGGIFGLQSILDNALGTHNSLISFDITLSGIENLTTPPTTVNGPAPLALVFLSLGLMRLCRRK